MSTLARTSPVISGREAVLVDCVANEVYAAHYTERRLSRFVIGTLAVLLLFSFILIHSLASRPVVTRYIRIDEMGRAQAIQYSDLSYSPREGEVRTYLTDWANYRFTINRETIATKYPLNYYFLASPLASQLMADDNAQHFASQVLSGRIDQSDVEVKSVTITSMSQELVDGAVMAKGTALVNIDTFYSPRNSREPRTEHWTISVTYYLNPREVNDHARLFPQFETINPLGMTITEFHASLISVDPITPGVPASVNPAPVSSRPPQGATR